MSHLCVATSSNRRGRRDGKYFVAEMGHYARCYKDDEVSQHKLPTKGRRHTEIRAEFNDITDMIDIGSTDHFAFFMHGTSRWLLGAGHNIWTIDQWAQMLEPVKSKIYIALYSCSNGSWIKRSAPGKAPKKYQTHWDISNGVMRGEYGFAMRLGYALMQLGKEFQIYAHTTRGDTTRNPKAVWITWAPGDTQIRRDWVVKPVSWLHRKKDPRGRERWLRWVKLLKGGDFRFNAPFMTRKDLEDYVDFFTKRS